MEILQKADKSFWKAKEKGIKVYVYGFEFNLKVRFDFELSRWSRQTRQKEICLKNLNLSPANILPVH